MSKFTDTIAAFWAHVQQSLFPFIETFISEPLTETLYDLIVILEFLRVEEVLRRVEQHGQVGAPLLIVRPCCGPSSPRLC